MKKTDYIVAIVAILLSVNIYQNFKSEFHAPVSENQLEALYSQSQYINPDSTTWIEDPPLYTLAGIKYFKGSDVSTINFELQPFTKYLFGLTTYLWGNPLLLQLLLYALLIIQTYVLSQKITHSSQLGVISSVIIGLDPLVRFHAHTAYLDLMQANLILLFLNNVSFVRPIITGLVIGLIALSKSWMIGGLVFFVWSMLLVMHKQKSHVYLLSTLSAFFMYCIGYASFFLAGNNAIDFVGLHWKIIRLYRSYVPEYPKGEVFRILLLGKWQKWYGDFGLSRVVEWWLPWAVGTFGTIWVFITKRTIKANITTQASAIFFGLYLTSISLKLVFPRYIIPILPLLYTFPLLLLKKYDANA